jgi:hypothetical protein
VDPGQPSATEPVAESSLSFELIERGEPQEVNLPKDEYSAYSFVVRNRGDTAVCVTGGTFLPSRVAFDPYEAFHLTSIRQIDHRGHISVSVQEPKPATPISVPLDFAVPPHKMYEFTLWFRLDELTQGDRLGYFEIEGRLTLYCDDGTVTSDPIRLLLCSMPRKDVRAWP